jgi:hypothetical protein
VSKIKKYWGYTATRRAMPQCQSFAFILYNEETCIFRRLRRVDGTAGMGETGNAHKIFVVKTLDETPIVIREKGIEDNIKIYFTDINCEDESLMKFSQDLRKVLNL